jgi:hypothetical protein
MGDLVEMQEQLAGKRHEAVLLMASGLSCKQISQQIGIAVQTLYNWRSADPAFRAELTRLQRKLYAEGIDALRGLVREAVESLSSVMSDPAARDSDRIAAARTVLQFAMSAQHGDNPDIGEDDREFREVADELARLVRAGHAS